MKLKRYSNFVETRLIKEEFLGKMLRNWTGKNEERVKSFSDLLNRITEEVNKKFSEKLNQYAFNQTEKEEVKKLFIKNWGNELTSGPSPFNKVRIGESEYLSNHLIGLFYLNSNDDLEFLKDLSDEEFTNCFNTLNSFLNGLDTTLKSVYDKTFIPENMVVVLSKRKDDLLNNLSKLKETILKVPEIGVNIKYWKEGIVGLEKKDISTLVRSLCVQLPTYDKYDYNSESIANKYSQEFGINYKDRFKDFLDMKVSELPKYKELSSEIEVIKRYLEECENKEKEVYSENEIYEKMTGFSIAPENDHGKYWKLGYKEASDIFYKNFGYLGCEKKVVTGFDLLKEFSDMSVKDILNNREFGQTGLGNLNLVIPEDNDNKRCVDKKDENGEWYLSSTNVFYSGQIRSNLNLENIDNLINKRGHLERSGKGLWCVPYISAAAQYAHLRVDQVKNDHREEALKTKDSDYSPTIYKITVKPGSKFLHKSDTDMDKGEMEKLLKMGLVGNHSGNVEVGGGNTVEVCIVDPTCIESIEKVSIQEIESTPESDWYDGVSSGKKEDLVQFFKDYQKYKE